MVQIPAALIGLLGGGATAAGAGAASAAGAGAAAGAESVLGGLTSQMKGFNDTIKQTNKEVGQAQQQFQQMNSTLKKLIELPLKPFIMVLQEVHALTNQYVAAFSPNEAKQFAMVLKDIDAVIGEMLLPITRAFRDMLRYFGDVLAGITPTFQAFIQDGLEAMRPAIEMAGQVLLAFAPIVMNVAKVLFDAFAQVFSPKNLEAILSWMNTAAEILGPLIPIFVKLAIVLNPLFWILKASAFVMGLLADGLNMFYKWILEVLQALGLVRSQEEKDASKGSSAGKAAVSTGTTSAMSALTKLQQNAFSIGGTGPDNAKKTADNTSTLVKLWENLPDNIAKALAPLINNVKGQVAEAGLNGLTNAATGVNPLFGLGLNLAQGRNPFG